MRKKVAPSSFAALSVLLQALRETAPTGGVLSAVLDVSPARWASKAHLMAFRNVCKAIRPNVPAAEHAGFETAVARAERLLSSMATPTHPGLALYVAPDPRYIFAAALPDRSLETVSWAERPELEPLERALDDSECVVVALGLSEVCVRQWLKRFNERGLDGLVDAPRPGRPATYSPEQVGEVIAASLTKPQALGLPFASWMLDRLAVYLNEQKGIAMKRSRIDHLLLAEGLRWRQQHPESTRWFGQRAALDQQGWDGDAGARGRPVDRIPSGSGCFAQKRGPSRPSTRPLLTAVS